MIAQAMRSAIGSGQGPTNTELRFHTITNNPDATECVMARRRHNPQKSQNPKCYLHESLYFLTDGGLWDLEA
jgi:hypothetical protein